MSRRPLHEGGSYRGEKIDLSRDVLPKRVVSGIRRPRPQQTDQQQGTPSSDGSAEDNNAAS